ncbi:DUF3052 family protein [Nonomuraea endophytica]|uniref:DUF3052 domain-containing protein n=1 Tax=Nonomuraea endophytica TaxID=714136 RepID=A0A7W8A512_9ACTN|nr:DUF3052 family protein [Nonomuraea endophytica]MBB5078846.1 hypothetical protein [Nonomuraea endophytica]
MAGYSGTPLPQKLGIKPGHRVLATALPDDLDLGAPVHTRAGREPYDVILIFCGDFADLRRRFATAAGRLVSDGGLWVCWPKRASGRQTDLGENLIREYGLANGLVDNKVAAVDATWSALRFVYRLADR